MPILRLKKTPVVRKHFRLINPRTTVPFCPVIENTEAVAVPEPDRVGKLATFEVDGERVCGRISNVAGGVATLRLAIPDQRGILLVTDNEIVHPLAGLEICEAAAHETEQKVRAFENRIPFETDGQKMLTIRDKDLIVDYRDVRIMGFASTFASVTPADRDGDYVVEGAFKDTLKTFKENPVMLTNHQNTVQALAGSYTKIGVNSKGLAIEGLLSNAPDTISVRFKVAEGHLKALSIGGFFFYGRDGKAIEKVDLFEISLIPVPANPDALISTRQVTAADCAKAWRRTKSSR